MKRDAKSDKNLQSISPDMQQVMTMLDTKITGGGDLNSVCTNSSAMMKKLKEMGETGGGGGGGRRKHCARLLTNTMAQLNRLEKTLNGQPNDATISATDAVTSDPNSKTLRFKNTFNLAKMAAEHTDAQNKELHQTYGRALETWYETVENVRQQREKAISDHTETELERKRLAYGE